MIRIFFQFEQLIYNSSYHTTDAVQGILTGSFMVSEIPGDSRTYAQAFTTIGQELGVSPFHLASRVLQEQGVRGSSALISGAYPGYEEYYNYFNISASGIGDAETIRRGLSKAKMEGWNTRYSSLYGGAKIIGSQYILWGQDTLYLEKFNVTNGKYVNYTHQYMQNIEAPYYESSNIYKAYQKAGVLERRFVFKIPVYENMPASACAQPETTDTITLDKTSVSSLEVDKSITLVPYVNGSKVDNVNDMIFTSSNTAVAVVDAQGKVTAISPGDATISCTRSGAGSANCTVTVVKGNPVVSTPVLSPVTYREGIKLSDVALPSGWAWVDGDTTISVGTSAYAAVYTPEDITKYNTITKNVNFMVTKAIPMCQVPAGLEVESGSVLGSITLPDGFSWESDAEIMLIDIGEYIFYMSYNPDEENYYTVGHIPIIVQVKENVSEPSSGEDENGAENGGTSGSSTSSGSTTTGNAQKPVSTGSTTTENAQKPVSAGSTTTGNPQSAASTGNGQSGNTSADNTSAVDPQPDTQEENTAAENPQPDTPEVTAPVENSQPSAASTAGAAANTNDAVINNNTTAAVNESSTNSAGENNSAGEEAENAGQSEEPSYFRPAVTIQMEDTTILTTEKMQMAKEQNFDLLLDMGGAVTWSIDVDSIDENAMAEANMGVALGTNSVPQKLISTILNGNKYLEIALAHQGEFGFEPVLNIALGKEYSGKYANLFYYDPETETLEFICDAVIGPDGVANLRFEHASCYLIIVSDESMSGVSFEDENVNPMTRWIIVGVFICMFLVVVGCGVFFFLKKRKEKEDDDEEENIEANDDGEEDRDIEVNEEDEPYAANEKPERHFQTFDLRSVVKDKEPEEMPKQSSKGNDAEAEEDGYFDEDDWIEDDDWQEPEPDTKTSRSASVNISTEDDWLDDDDGNAEDDWIEDDEWEE